MPKRAEEKTTKTLRRASTATSKRVAAKRVTRKAPIKTAHTSTKKTPPVKFAMLVAVGLLAVGGASFAIGKSDSGPINVGDTISQRASVTDTEGNTEESAAIRAINSQQNDKPNLPNGGLVGRGNKQTNQQKLAAQAKASQPVATSTASTTEDTASSSSETNSDSIDDEDSDDPLEEDTEDSQVTQ